MKPYILKILRQRIGLAEDDSSRDAVLETFDPEFVMRELVAWEFGSAGWTGWFAQRLIDTGADIKKLAQ